MKKDSAFKLKSGNKPSISKMMGISPTKKVLDQSTGKDVEKET